MQNETPFQKMHGSGIILAFPPFHWNIIIIIIIIIINANDFLDDFRLNFNAAVVLN